jgi:hypothetical protein
LDWKELTVRNKNSYLSYLLRIWQAKEHRGKSWMASLEKPDSGTRKGFSRLEDLFDFLRDQTAEMSSDQPTDSPSSETRVDLEED